jgi:hypothetical protein
MTQYTHTAVRSGARRILKMLNDRCFYASSNATMRFSYAVRRVFGPPGFELTATPCWFGLRLTDERLFNFRRVGRYEWRFEQLSQRTAEMLAGRWPECS